MKKNIVLFLTICSVLLNIALGIHLSIRKPECEHIHLEEIDRTKDVVPNENAAEKIAEIFMKSQDGKLAWGKKIDYGVEVAYDDQNYEWIVYYDANANVEDGYMILDANKKIRIRRDYGIITWFVWR